VCNEDARLCENCHSRFQLCVILGQAVLTVLTKNLAFRDPSRVGFYDLTRFVKQIDGRSNAAGCPFCQQLTGFVGQKGNEHQISQSLQFFIFYSEAKNRIA